MFVPRIVHRRTSQRRIIVVGIISLDCFDSVGASTLDVGQPVVSIIEVGQPATTEVVKSFTHGIRDHSAGPSLQPSCKVLLEESHGHSATFDRWVSSKRHEVCNDVADVCSIRIGAVQAADAHERGCCAAHA